MIQRFMVVLMTSVLLAGRVCAGDPPVANLESPVPVHSETPPAPQLAESPLLADFTHADHFPGYGQRWWFSADYEFAWIKGMRVPPLVTTSPAGTAQASAGILGAPTTTVLFGNKETDSGMRPGTSLDFGYWLNADHTLGIQAGYRIVGAENTNFSATSNGSTILARPFTNATTGAATAVLIGFPGLSSGTVTARTSSNNFQGVHLDMTEQWNCNKYLRFESVFGYRYFRYDEDLDVAQSMNPLGTTFVPGTLITAADHFATKNDFNGGEFGLRTTFLMDRFFLQVLTQVDVGQMYNTVTVNGSSQVSVPGAATSNRVGGLLALPSNIGTFTGWKWVALPEISTMFGYQFNDNVKFKIGYSVLALSDVTRPGDQIDLTVNTTLLPGNGPATGPTRPAPPAFRRAEVWVQSLNLGVEISF
jgi:hypothetical protein